jgi:predicted membrane protein
MVLFLVPALLLDRVEFLGTSLQTDTQKLGLTPSLPPLEMFFSDQPILSFEHKFKACSSSFMVLNCAESSLQQTSSFGPLLQKNTLIILKVYQNSIHSIGFIPSDSQWDSVLTILLTVHSLFTALLTAPLTVLLTVLLPACPLYCSLYC